MPNLSSMPHSSAILPPSMRTIVLVKTSTCLPVGGMLPNAHGSGSTHRHAECNLVLIRDHVLNRVVQVRESCQHHADELSGSLGTGW
jgi:hypothetical protein